MRRTGIVLTGAAISMVIGAGIAACGSSSSDGAQPPSGAGSGGTSGASGQAGHAGGSAGNAGATTGGAAGATQGAGGANAGAAGTMDAGMDAGPPGLTCGKLLSCDQGCPSSGSCTDDCYAKATQVAQGLFDTFNGCLDQQCAGSSDPNCDMNAATGACISQLITCEGDKAVGPADPDGGGTVMTMDAGMKLNCGGLNTCIAGCGPDGGTSCTSTCDDQATPEATALYAALTSCLAMACPSTPGGPCEMQGLACSGCIEQVTLAQPNTCATPYIACNSDSSNLPDGGGAPTALEDGGSIATVLTGLDQAASTLVASNGYLYFTQVVTGSPVYRFAVNDPSEIADGGAMFGDGGTIAGDGGALLESIGPGLPTPVSLAVDEKNVYVWSVGTFALASSVNNQDGSVVQIPLNGDPPITLSSNVEAFYDSGYLNAVAVDSANVYWLDGASGDDGAIMKAPIGGGVPMAVFTGQQVPAALTTDGTNVYWGNWGTFDDQGVSKNDGTVWQGSVNGGTPIMLASGQEGPSTIVVDGNNVYWVNLGHLGAQNFPALNSGSLVSVPIGGGALTTIAAAQSVPFSLVLSGTKLYWSDYGLSGPGLIMSASTDGTGVTPLVSGLDDPSALAVSGGTLFWTNANSSPDDGFIMSLNPL